MFCELGGAEVKQLFCSWHTLLPVCCLTWCMGSSWACNCCTSLDLPPASMIPGPSFFGRAFHLLRSEALRADTCFSLPCVSSLHLGMQFILAPRLYVSIHLPFPTSCPADFRLQHQMQQQTSRGSFTGTHYCVKSNPF